MVTTAKVSVDVEQPNGRLRKWEDAISTHIGLIEPAVRDQQVSLRCLSADDRPFMGRIEHGALGDVLLCKVAATPLSVRPVTDNARTDTANSGDARFRI